MSYQTPASSSFVKSKLTAPIYRWAKTVLPRLSDTERDAVSREFRLLSLGNLPFYERYQRPDYLLSDYNISQGYLTLRETTGGTGAAAYDASLETKAAYIEAESQLTGTVRATSDGRLEIDAASVEEIDEPEEPYEY